MNHTFSKWRRCLSKSSHLLLKFCSFFCWENTRHALLSTLSLTVFPTFYHFGTKLFVVSMACQQKISQNSFTSDITSKILWTWTHKVESLEWSGLKSLITLSHSVSLFKEKGCFNAKTSVLFCENHSMINRLELFTTSIFLDHYWTLVCLLFT